MRRFVLAAAALLLATSSAWSQEKLILVTVSPAGGDNSIHYAAWGKKVTAESQGTLDIDVRDGTSLANFANVLDRVGNDVIQIGWMLHGQVGGKFPMTETTTLPFVVDDVMSRPKLGAPQSSLPELSTGISASHQISVSAFPLPRSKK